MVTAADEEGPRGDEPSAAMAGPSRSLSRGLISLVILVAMVVGLLLAVPGLHGVADAVSDMSGGWLAIAVHQSGSRSILIADGVRRARYSGPCDRRAEAQSLLPGFGRNETDPILPFLSGKREILGENEGVARGVAAVDRGDVVVREVRPGIERGDRRVVPGANLARVNPSKDGPAELESLLI